MDLRPRENMKDKYSIVASNGRDRFEIVMNDDRSRQPDSLDRYIVTSDVRFTDSTIQRFNDLTKRSL